MYKTDKNHRALCMYLWKIEIRLDNYWRRMISCSYKTGNVCIKPEGKRFQTPRRKQGCLPEMKPIEQNYSKSRRLKELAANPYNVIVLIALDLLQLTPSATSGSSWAERRRHTLPVLRIERSGGRMSTRRFLFLALSRPGKETP